jgi:hypothetical protein
MKWINLAQNRNQWDYGNANRKFGRKKQKQLATKNAKFVPKQQHGTVLEETRHQNIPGRALDTQSN